MAVVENVVEFPVEDTTRGQAVSEGWGATVFLERHKTKLFFNDDEGRWYLYDGAIWRKQRKSLGFEWAHALAKEMSVGAGNKKEMQSARFARNIDSIAAANNAVNRQAKDLDADAFACGSPEATLNLKTGKLRPPSPSDYITKSIANTPDPEFADCPRWHMFLEETTGGDQELIVFLQRWCGYCLTGDTREHTLLFIFGDGGNGKSVFQNTITGVMGDYAATASMSTFTSSKMDKHPADLAMLRGARLVTASETEEGRLWDEARIKQLTGGDPISAHFMRQDFFTYRPQFKLMIVGNHQPTLQSVDDAIRRRLCMVPFMLKPAKPDPHLEDTLRTEWPGILNWMVAGCLDWQKHGLPRPSTVLVANEDYLSDQDTLSQFLAEECEVEHGNNWKRERVSVLFEAFQAYCKRVGVNPGSIRGFSPKLVHRGFKKGVSGLGKHIEGIQLIRRSSPFE